MVKKYLNAPGPTAVPAEILAEMSKPLIHHRTPQFSAIIKENKELLQTVFQTKSPVITLSSSGTGAMESSIVNFMSRGDKVLVLSAGKFGERFALIGRNYGLEVIELTKEYGQDIKPAEVEKALKENPDIKGVYTEYSETSTAVAFDVKGIADVVSKTDALLVVDGITAIGAMEFKMDDWGVDIALAGSQKSLMIPPGLAFIAVSEKARAKMETSDLPKFYFDLKAELKAEEKNSTAWTPAITLVIGLNHALKMIANEGLEKVWKRHSVIAEALRKSVQAIGLELFVQKGVSYSNSVTSVKTPPSVDGGKIPALMRDKFGVTIAGGQGSIKGKIIRLGHLGYTDKSDVILELQALEFALKELGYDFTPGKMMNVAQEYLLENYEF